MRQDHLYNDIAWHALLTLQLMLVLDALNHEKTSRLI